jgi:O-phospho-L-seryl-tRNASec:L-selenocysteinyl-tRNA synthase
MNNKSYELAKQLIPSTYVNQGQDAIRRRENLTTDLLSHRKIPEDGWDDQSIEYVLLFEMNE